MPYGAYDCTIAISDEQAINGPRPVSLRLHINTTIHVPIDFSTIQPAIDAANVDGDTVVVADGTYTGQLNNYLRFLGKRITLRSENGPENCIILAGERDRGFDFHWGETEKTIVDGFTVTNADNVAGIWITQASDPTIRNCIITQNMDEGIRCSHSNPTIENCQITDNADGGIVLESSCARIHNCLISGNTNRSGLSIGSGSPMITNCRITRNSTDFIASGIGCFGRGSPTIVNSVIAWNHSGQVAGTISCGSDSACKFINCTIYGNDDTGIRAHHEGASITNCIVTNNHPAQIDDRTANGISVTYSIIQGYWSGVGNIDADPLFVDGPGGDLRLTIQSRAVDAGNNSAVPRDLNDLDDDGNTQEPIPIDVGGEPRFVEIIFVPDTGQGTPPIVDIGAHEYQPCTDDAECIDELFCNGFETCTLERCVVGVPPCSADKLCRESDDQCVDCLVHPDCDDSDPCNGLEICRIDGTCTSTILVDCNSNQVADFCDLSDGTSSDCNANAIPDECEKDSDGDGVIDPCDLCAHLDDAIFGPDCVGAIPTVSEWGLVAMALLLITSAKVCFGRRLPISPRRRSGPFA